ncbi:MAG: hypothetical protein ACE5NW_09450 [Acidiferrobacterales bacterium]
MLALTETIRQGLGVSLELWLLLHRELRTLARLRAIGDGLCASLAADRATLAGTR